MEQKRERSLGAVWGALAGVALVALLALGWKLGGRSEGDPEAEAPLVEGPTATAAQEPSPHVGADLDVITDPAVESLRRDLAAAPERLDLRKRLAIELLRRAQFYAAFDEAGRILEQSPDDVDGLFVTAAIRVRMGQPSRALPLLERVLEQAPDHVPALTAKGQALLKTGHADTAVAVWNRALELSGGSNSQVEEMLRSVPAGAGAPHPLSTDATSD